jgi:hypothetical protein
MLLLAALAERLEKLPDDEQEPVEGFSPRKIRGRYLTNNDEIGEKFFKLILSQADKEALHATRSVAAGRDRQAHARQEIGVNTQTV